MEDKRLITAASHKAAVNRLELLIDKGEAGETSANEEEEIKYLSILIDAYEDQNFHIGKPHPVEYIRYILENKNLKQQDIVNALGISKSTLSNILNYRKKLSIEMIRGLHKHLDISYDILMIEYNLKPA